MKTLITLVAMTICSAALLSGCVSSGKYMAKEQESLQLSKALEDQKGSYTELQETLKKKEQDLLMLESTNKSQEERIASLSADNAELKRENTSCAEALKPANLLKTLDNIITEKQSRIDALQEELRKLKTDQGAKKETLPAEPVKEAPAAMNTEEPAMPASNEIKEPNVAKESSEKTVGKKTPPEDAVSAGKDELLNDTDKKDAIEMKDLVAPDSGAGK